MLLSFLIAPPFCVVEVVGAALLALEVVLVSEGGLVVPLPVVVPVLVSEVDPLVVVPEGEMVPVDSAA